MSVYILTIILSWDLAMRQLRTSFREIFGPAGNIVRTFYMASNIYNMTHNELSRNSFMSLVLATFLYETKVIDVLSASVLPSVVMSSRAQRPNPSLPW